MSWLPERLELALEPELQSPGPGLQQRELLLRAAELVQAAPARRAAGLEPAAVGQRRADFGPVLTGMYLFHPGKRRAI